MRACCGRLYHAATPQMFHLGHVGWEILEAKTHIWKLPMLDQIAPVPFLKL